jgi:hypothetical protein
VTHHWDDEAGPQPCENLDLCSMRRESLEGLVGLSSFCGEIGHRQTAGSWVIQSRVVALKMQEESSPG